MVVAGLYSGGKDSTLALHRIIGTGIEVGLLLTIESKNRNSYMFHYPNTNWTALQAEALGIKHKFVQTEGKKEEELKDLEKALVDNGVTALITGATYSKYQGDRIADMCNKLGIENLAPLWHIEPLDELRELDRDFDAIVTSVSAEGLDKSFLGERIDQGMIDRLVLLNKRYGINLLFEGGEAESFVLDAPLFRKWIKVNKSHIEWNGTSGAYFIDDAELVGKK